MKIVGLQRTTLIDYPGRVACTLFLYGCNFRCGFCYNPELVIGEVKSGFSESEVLSFLEGRKGKLDAVCITGGEPLLSLKKDFVRRIKAMGFLIKLDTNGMFPDRLRDFVDSGLVDYVAMDVKSSPGKYAQVTGMPVDLSKIEQSIRIIASLDNYEFRTTVVGRYHDAFEMRSLGRWVVKVLGFRPKRYVLQGFKHDHEMIDKNLSLEKNVSFMMLDEFRSCVQEFFVDVEVRV